MKEIRNRHMFDGAFDFLVCGAGISACTAVDYLTRSGARTLMLGSNQKSVHSVGEHLNPHVSMCARQHFTDQDMLQQHLPSPGILSCWNEATPTIKDYFLSPYGNGLNLDRALLNKQFLTQARNSGASFADGHISKVIRSNQGGFNVEFLTSSQHCELRCHNIIDATGRARAVVRRQGSQARSLSTMVAAASWHTIDQGCRSNLEWLLLEAAEYGWWYSLLVPGNRLVVVLICNGSLIRGSRTERDKLLQNLIEHVPHTRARLAQTQKCLHRGVWLANTSYLTNLAGAGWVAVGDCAASFDPVIGSGISHALKSAASGADAMLKFLDGEHDALDAYAKTERTIIQKNLEFQVQAYRLEQRWPTSPFWSKAQNLGNSI